MVAMAIQVIGVWRSLLSDPIPIRLYSTSLNEMNLF